MPSFFLQAAVEKIARVQNRQVPKAPIVGSIVVDSSRTTPAGISEAWIYLLCLRGFALHFTQSSASLHPQAALGAQQKPLPSNKIGQIGSMGCPAFLNMIVLFPAGNPKFYRAHWDVKSEC